MNMTEFEKVRNMTYLEYCDYLQAKYGIGLADYMTKSFNPNRKCKRTSEGLIAHHKAEDKAIMLSTKEFAERCPFEWQSKENIVYCDMLEHLWLHILICKYPSPDRIDEDVGIGGAANFLIPELNDLYSGWQTNQEWRMKQHAKVINDKDVYLAMMKVFIDDVARPRRLDPKVCLFTSFNAPLGLWSAKKNYAIWDELLKMCKGK